MVSGGADELLGLGGNDFFTILSGQTGLIDGGSGYDRLYLKGPGPNNEFAAGLSLVGIQELTIDSNNLFATVEQLKGFSKFGVNNDSESFHFFQG